ncbi:FAD dependent oxidoreductase [Mycena rosella]|uniref:L-2-hydroxyglutarate dehydrogenase, mitochondrial n=1 Tax=Mycena rosella TaxID=1033263 RepID=A0AAD7DEH9_MYCRO|nr:FAD dependent oxidoreductase [Mycena rosella]
MVVLAIRSSLNSAKYAYKAPESAVDYLIVGGGEQNLWLYQWSSQHLYPGVVGLAIARRLSQFSDKSTILVERHTRAGEETSSRNSEVIHSGLYYPPESLKTHLCIRGRELLYERCKSNNIPFRKTGKLVVANENQRPYIENLHAKAQKIAWPSSFKTARDEPALPTQLLSGAEAREMEPNLSKEITGALCLEKDISESDGGDLAYSTRIVRVDPYSSSADIDGARRGWVVQMVTGEQAEEGDAILAKTLINATGLSAPLIVNALLPEAKRIPLFYARGSYAKYSGPGVSGISHLIYPCPETEGNAHGFQSLGTHLTLDLQGKVRFGPDLQWISPADGQDPDFWKAHLVPDDSMLEAMHHAVSRYLPEVRLEGLQPDYVGIRPKLVGPQGGFQDFVFRTDYPDTDRESQHSPLISLLGIESPGLTASLAIAEHVVENMLGHVQGR